MSTQTSKSNKNSFDENSFSEKQLLDLIQVSEITERHSDMFKYLTALVVLKTSKGNDLSSDERSLLNVGFKNTIGPLRMALRTLETNIEDGNASLLIKYKRHIEEELEDKCNQIIDLMEKHIMPLVKDCNDDKEVFYFKMLGDYYRYLSEFMVGSKLDISVTKSSEYYLKASKICDNVLELTNPLRLGLILNYSVFCYEIEKCPEKAIKVAKEAFDKALNDLDTINLESYKDTTLILQLLRDNLTLWTSELNETEENQ
jgi:hypothetical protein